MYVYVYVCVYEPKHAVSAPLMVHPALQLSHMGAALVVQWAPLLGEPLSHLHTFAVRVNMGGCA